MAEGHRDYTQGYILERSSSGRYSTLFWDNDTATIDADESVNVYNYDVPEGSILWIGIIDVCTDSPKMSNISLGLADTSIGFKFMENYRYDFGSIGGIYLSAGDNLQVSLHNNDEVSHDYYVTIYGYLESI